MKQEDKELLLKDLCTRLPYRVVCQCDNIKTQGVLKEIGMNYNMCRLYNNFTDEYEDCFIFDCRPYLFPLSSMTEEQDEEYNKLNSYELGCFPSTEEALDYLIQNHFDYRYLIDKGLAIDATGKSIY